MATSSAVNKEREGKGKGLCEVVKQRVGKGLLSSC